MTSASVTGVAGTQAVGHHVVAIGRHQPEAVWPAVASAGGLAEWIGADVVLEPRCGGDCTFTFSVDDENPPVRLVGTVTRFDRGAGVQYTFAEGSLAFELRPANGGTNLVVTDDVLHLVIGRTEAPSYTVEIDARR
jgi:uncharacterized protein YndB with AHSA1/START domain